MIKKKKKPNGKFTNLQKSSTTVLVKCNNNSIDNHLQIFQISRIGRNLKYFLITQLCLHITVYRTEIWRKHFKMDRIILCYITLKFPVEYRINNKFKKICVGTQKTRAPIIRYFIPTLYTTVCTLKCNYFIDDSRFLSTYKKLPI